MPQDRAGWYLTEAMSSTDGPSFSIRQPRDHRQASGPGSDALPGCRAADILGSQASAKVSSSHCPPPQLSLIHSRKGLQFLGPVGPSLPIAQAPASIPSIPHRAGLYFLAGRGFRASKNFRKIPMGRASL